MTFSQMDGFIKQSKEIIFGNLCQNTDDNTFRIIDCKHYLNSALTRGIGEAFDMFYANSKIISNKKLADFVS